jgi:peptidoglycan/xylan/chitin deacetylase (PgdA/CDA1 family)
MRAILTWHSIDPSGSPVSVGPDAFREQVAFLASGRVRVVPLAALPDVPPDADAVALTFDDAFANLAEHAFPRLAEHALPATVFVVSDHVGARNDWGGRDAPGIPTLPLLSWAALGRAGEGGVEIGAHTRRHPDLSRLGAAALEDEIAGCVSRIEGELGITPTSFAYPFGRTSEAALTVVRDTYRRAVTTELRALGDDEDRMLLPRLDMYYFRGPGQLSAWGSAAFRRRLWLRAQGRRVRELVAGGTGGGAA